MTQRGHGSIYFLQAGESGPIKVGFSTQPERRIANLQGGHYEQLRLLSVRPGHYYDERDLHEKLAPSRVLGEWYQPSPEVLAEIGEAA